MHSTDAHTCWQHYRAKAEEERMSFKVAKSLHDSAGSGDLDAVKVPCAPLILQNALNSSVDYNHSS